MNGFVVYCVVLFDNDEPLSEATVDECCVQYVAKDIRGQ